MFVGALTLIACGSDGDGSGAGGSGASSTSSGAGGSVPEEPKLGASCSEADPCPQGLSCFLELGCIVVTCPDNGPGGDHGCPANGFCHTIDSSEGGYCARTCSSDADCTAVNPELVCRQQSSTEAFGMMICILP